MVEAIPTYAQEAYAILYNRFGKEPFTPEYISWFLSEAMVKKIFYILEKKGWIKRIERGKYVCQTPKEIFKEMVKFKVPSLLRASNRVYYFTKTSAVEIWTDFTYIQRSWEHSPYFIAVLKKDLNYWIDYFKKHRIKVFVEKPEGALGEFVVLFPKNKLTFKIHNNIPVEELKKVITFCEKNIDTFEYPLAYLKEKYGIKTKVTIDTRVLEEAKKVV